MKKQACLVASMVMLSGCGTVVPTPGASVATEIRAAKAASVRVARVSDLAASWDAPRNEGQRVTFEASFERYSYAAGYGDTYHGYRLWDHEGHWVLVNNLHTLTSQLGRREDAKDLSMAASSALLRYGTFVKVEGLYHPSRQGTSHGGVYTLPPSVDVLTIDSRPLSSYLSGG